MTDCRAQAVKNSEKESFMFQLLVVVKIVENAE